MKRPPRRLIEHASNGYPSRLLDDARYISQKMKLGALGIPSYRSFSLDELEAATNNFGTSAFIGEASLGQSPAAIAVSSMKRPRGPSGGSQMVSCLVDGCRNDLSSCREYHRRHKVCEVHSKTPIVLVGGQEQRFCQQCSRMDAVNKSIGSMQHKPCHIVV